MHSTLAKSFYVTGVPAILIILAIVAVLVIGLVAIVKFIGRKAKGD